MKIKHHYEDDRHPFKPECRTVSFSIMLNGRKYSDWRYYLPKKKHKFAKLRSLVKAKHRLIKTYVVSQSL